MLLMKKIFFDAIKQGRKTTTLRFWRYQRVKPGSIHTIVGLGRVKIVDVVCLSYDSLTERDAKDDGFATLAELKKALADMYPPEKQKERKLFKIHFALLP